MNTNEPQTKEGIEGESETKEGFELVELGDIKKDTKQFYPYPQTYWDSTWYKGSAPDDYP